MVKFSLPSLLLNPNSAFGSLFNAFFYFFQANVMLEYELDAAEALLNKNLANANTKLSQVLTDLDFLRYVTSS